MANSIFSTYSTAENRVTSTILAVFEKLNSSTVTRIHSRRDLQSRRIFNTTTKGSICNAVILTLLIFS